MGNATTNRRQRPTSALGFSCGVSAFLGHGTIPHSSLAFVESTCRPCHASPTSRDLFFGTEIAPTNVAASGRSPSPMMVAAPPPKVGSPRHNSRFGQPVPAAEPHEILPPRRGRNSRRRTREAEHFRKYIYLRRQLKPWSDDFRAKHGRTPSLIDVHASDIPGLLDRFVEYLEALEGLRFDVSTSNNTL